MTFLKIVIAITTDCDQPDAQSVALVKLIPVDVSRSRVDSLLRKAADRRKDAVHILTILKGPWSIQDAGLIGLDFSDDDIDQMRRKLERIDVIWHRLVGVIQQELRAVWETNGEQVSIGSLSASTARMHDEILDLKEAI